MRVGPLAGGGLSPQCQGIDAGLLWALATGFRDFRRSTDPCPTHWPMAIELARGGTVGALRGAGVFVPAAHQSHGRRWLTGDFDIGAAHAVWGGALAAVVRRFELQLPVIPHRPRHPTPLAGQATPKPRRRSRAATLFGVIDSGCPFAHAMLRNRAGTGTRMLSIWDQDAIAPAFADRGGWIPPDMGYGAEIDRAGLNALMARCASPGQPKTIDEARCYRMAGYDVLRERFGHGAGVMGLLTNRRSSDWIDSLRPGPARSRHAQADADYVFVQVPRDAVQDASSASLARYVIDGLRYIVSCAGKGQDVVVNLSDGTSRGPHDGHALVDEAIADLVQEQAEQGRRLRVVVAAGNTRDEERHACFDQLRSGQRGRVCLHVPADNESPVFVNLRLPLAGSARVRLLAPGAVQDQVLSVVAGQAQGAFDDAGSAVWGLILPQPAKGLAACGLIVIAATRAGSDGRPPAPSGRWWIEVEPLDKALTAKLPVDIWISRGRRNCTALPRSRQARFLDVDGSYAALRHLRSSEVDPDPPRSPIRRLGSLNALACSNAEGVIVVGASYRSKTEASVYSSAGPAAGEASNRRMGPDFSAPVDESRGLQGMRVAGNRSGDACRATGSSFAAPQIALLLATGQGVPLRRDAPGRGIADPLHLGPRVAPD